MPTPWQKTIKDSKQLLVFNKAKPWATQFTAAVKTFNGLKFGVTFVETNEEKKANVVVLNAAGPTKYAHPEQTVSTASDFKYDGLHGQCNTLAYAATAKTPQEIFFAVIFLPGKIKKATDGQRQVVIVHELIHACGLDDHDLEGIMAAAMKEDGAGLSEYFGVKGGKPMPPIRVGSQTSCKMKMLWDGGPACTATP